MVEVEPKAGQVWSARYADRRVMVTRVWGDSGRLSLRTVAKIGGTWRASRHGKASTCEPEYFCSNYRFLEVS